MIQQILVVAQTIAPHRVFGPAIFLFILNLVPLCLIIWGIVWFVKYLKGGRQEQQRLRMELGKLADELQQIRQELKGSDESLVKENDNNGK